MILRFFQNVLLVAEISYVFRAPANCVVLMLVKLHFCFLTLASMKLHILVFFNTSAVKLNILVFFLKI